MITYDYLQEYVRPNETSIENLDKILEEKIKVNKQSTESTDGATNLVTNMDIVRPTRQIQSRQEGMPTTIKVDLTSGTDNANGNNK